MAKKNTQRTALNLFIIGLCIYITSKVGWEWGLFCSVMYFMGKVSVVIDEWQDHDSKRYSTEEVDRWY